MNNRSPLLFSSHEGFTMGIFLHRDRAPVRSHRRDELRCRRRRLLAEPLEARRLLSADSGGFRHNVFDPEDVNDDGQVSAVDALMVINAMNRIGNIDAEMFTDVNGDGVRSAVDALRVINRINRDRRLPDSPRHDPPSPTVPTEFRSIDGTGNNLADPELGSADEPLLRIADADYADGISAPGGEDRPSTREISTALSDVGEEAIWADRDLSAFVYVWGQFLDHDIDLTESQEDGEMFPIPVPTGDASFDPTGSGTVTIPLSRSQFDATTGDSIDNPRQQISSITAYVDGSQVYGSDHETADGLRTFQGGRLVINDDGLLPRDDEGMVIAGDVRASENISLTSLHTLFVREHNRIANRIAEANPSLDDEAIYQQAHSIVVAQLQAITYNEFLPALLGNRALSRYEGYDASVDPTIANEFSTAAFRFGHSTLNDDIEFFDNEGRAVRDAVELKDAFFNSVLLEENGIDAILKYDASSLSQEIDLMVVDSVRNFLFGPPGAGGLDLVALNIQRGRDHGLADYNSTREAYGLDRVESIAEITSDVVLQEKLEALYGDVDNLDLWVGLLAEDHVEGASVGELTRTIIADQFERLRDGDRFWYENVFAGRDLRELQETSLSDVIERNTTVKGLQDNVFFFRARVSGQITAASPTNVAATSDSRVSTARRDSTTGVPGVAVELLDDEGNVVDRVVTDSRGKYSFESFAETGDYQIRIAADDSSEVVSTNPLDVLISTGNTRLSGVNFVVTV